MHIAKHSPQVQSQHQILFTFSGAFVLLIYQLQLYKQQGLVVAPCAMHNTQPKRVLLAG